jgi:pimeloyl-ACP methyl ester carboxylesterase
MKNKVLLFLLTISVLVYSSCSKNNDQASPEVKTFLLVHGAWQAPYVWAGVKAQLEKQGAQVITVELPGHGADQTAPKDITLDAYRDKVLEALNKVNGKVILVGHSLGGMVVTEVAESAPDKIEKLVYLGAFLPVSGQSLLDLALTDTESQLNPALVPSTDQLTLGLVQDNITKIFIQDGSDTVKTQVLQNYRPEPAVPFTNKVTLTAARYGSVTKVYIKTLEDHAITPALQARMLSASGIKTILQISTGHSPFLSKPDSVSILLNQIAR